MRGRLRQPRIMVVVLNCKRTIRPISNKVAKNATPCFTLNAPLAKGRFFVRSTILSRSRSHKSFITHPAPRIIIAPRVNRIIVINVSDVKFFIPPVARVMLQRHGSRSSHIPTGRSRRSKYR